MTADDNNTFGQQRSTRFSRRPTPVSSWANGVIATGTYGFIGYTSVYPASLAMGSHQVYPNGKAYVRAFSNLYQTTDLGATWAVCNDLSSHSGLGTNSCLVLPHLNNPNDDIVWIFSAEDSVNAIIRRESDGTITPGLAPSDGAGGYYHLAGASDVGGEDRCFAANAAEIWGGKPGIIRFVTGSELVYSQNGGGTWNVVDLSSYAGSGNFESLGGWPNDESTLFLYGENALGYTTDYAATYNDLLGSGASALFTVSDDSLEYVVDFVPVWV